LFFFFFFFFVFSISIGYQSAVEFGREGAKVLCVDVVDIGLGAVVKEIEALGGEAVSLLGDVTKEEDHKKMISEVLLRWGRLDIYFANAGVVGSGNTTFEDISAQEFQRTFEINTLGVFLGIKSAVEAMKRNNKGGSIIVTSSVAGLRAGAGPTDYSASKAAVVNMVQTIAYQLPASKIRVNAICPGLIETNMTSLVFGVFLLLLLYQQTTHLPPLSLLPLPWFQKWLVKEEPLTRLGNSTQPREQETLPKLPSWYSSSPATKPPTLTDKLFQWTVDSLVLFLMSLERLHKTLHPQQPRSNFRTETGTGRLSSW
jgi:NAD(P)-dependent dehydrogenase (short-subunit alcohol dehydrogenase family)